MKRTVFSFDLTTRASTAESLAALEDEELYALKRAVEVDERRRRVERLGEEEVRMREAEPTAEAPVRRYVVDVAADLMPVARMLDDLNKAVRS